MSIPSRILITGYTGFVGGYLVEQCRIRYPQAELFGLTGHPTLHTATPGMSDVRLSVADVTQPEAVRQVVAEAQPDLAIHLAAQSSVSASWKDPSGTLRVNAGGTIHLLEALRSEQLTPRVVLVGSGEQYGMVHPEDNPIREECPFDLQTHMQPQKLPRTSTATSILLPMGYRFCVHARLITSGHVRLLRL